MEKIKLFFSKALDVLFKHFTLVLVVAFVVAIADLLTLSSTDFALGWVLAFLYFFTGLIYKRCKAKNDVNYKL